jgi:rhamnogalacturonyl hydrolase YesR
MMAIKMNIALLLGLSSLSIGCIQDNAQTSTTTYSPAMANASSLSAADGERIRESALDLGALAARWQLSHMDNFDYIPESHRNKSADPRFWIQASFYIGLTRWAETVKDKDLVKRIAMTAEDNNYHLGERPLHGDDHAIGQTYLWVHEQTGNEAAYGPTQVRFDAILADPPTNSLELIEIDKPGFESACQSRWCWADALFMAPRTWLKLSNATGDPRYFEFGDSEYWATADYLFSDEYGLFFRDSRYFEMKSDNGNPVFWSRGNGWVFAALPLIIDDMPEGHPSKTRYLELYTKMAKSLVKVQNPNGYWPASLMDADKVTTPETSGTGFITFGLAWGVNNGVLSDEATINAVQKGWAALASAVDADGMLHWVQQVGKSPDPVQIDDTQLYGVGAFLLAAAEMTRWDSQPKTTMAYGRFVPERRDDFAWENDKVAFRVYGPAAPEAGHSSGVDNWFKKVDYSIIDKWYSAFVKGISYHEDRGEGYDPYHTGISRGTGGSSIWVDGKAYSAHNFRSYEILRSGGNEVTFSLQYEWQTPLGLVGESKTISLALGDQLYQVNSVFTLDGEPAALPVAIGLTTHDEKASVDFNASAGRISAWELIDDSGVGTGALVDPAVITDIQHIPSESKDESHIWIFTSSDNAGKLAWRAGFAWEATGDITTTTEWNAYLDGLATQN